MPTSYVPIIGYPPVAYITFMYADAAGAVVPTREGSSHTHCVEFSEVRALAAPLVHDSERETVLGTQNDELLQPLNSAQC